MNLTMSSPRIGKQANDARNVREDGEFCKLRLSNFRDRFRQEGGDFSMMSQSETS